MNVIWGTILLAVAPISELRGAIPFAFFHGVPLWLALCIGTAANLLVSPIAFLFLSFIHRTFYRHWAFYVKVFDATLLRTRRKLGPHVAKYGVWGVMLFVGIPLPITGAWTGTLGAWAFGLGKKRSILAVSCGVLIAGAIVGTLLAAGVQVGTVFLKQL
ncbi:MAG: COG2426 family protein [Sphaerochaetaceae bacterium]